MDVAVQLYVAPSCV